MAMEEGVISPKYIIKPMKNEGAEMKVNILLVVVAFIWSGASIGSLNDFYKKLEQEASSGDVLAQSRLGVMYLRYSKDYKKAFYWSEKAALHGNVDAQFCLGNIYLNGYGVNSNLAKAEYWLDKAASGGHRIAQNDLAMIYKKKALTDASCVRIMNLLLSSAKQEYDLAYLNIGNMYATGICVAKNIKSAIPWWEKAAGAHNGIASYNLFVAYSNGDEVVPNPEMAVFYLRQACKNGNEPACKEIKRRQ